MVFRERQIKLVEALKSGAYAQGNGQLRCEDDSFCCLGVACDIYHRETGRGTWRDDKPDYHFAVDDETECAWLPTTVAEWFGFANRTGKFGESSLMRMNDNGVSFSEIADFINREMDNSNTILFGDKCEGIF